MNQSVLSRTASTFKRVGPALLVAVALMAGACSSDPPPTPLEVRPVDDPSDGLDACEQGGLFPDDPEFRAAVCEPLLALAEMVGSGLEVDPNWGARIANATLDYHDNRDTALAVLARIQGEIKVTQAAAVP